MRKSTLHVLLGSGWSSGFGSLADLVTSSVGNTFSRAKRDRTPNKKSKRTYDFVHRTGYGWGMFKCRQDGELVQFEVHVRRASKKHMELYA